MGLRAAVGISALPATPCALTFPGLEGQVDARPLGAAAAPGVVVGIRADGEVAVGAGITARVVEDVWEAGPVLRLTPDDMPPVRVAAATASVAAGAASPAVLDVRVVVAVWGGPAGMTRLLVCDVQAGDPRARRMPTTARPGRLCPLERHWAVRGERGAPFCVTASPFRVAAGPVDGGGRSDDGGSSNGGGLVAASYEGGVAVVWDVTVPRPEGVRGLLTDWCPLRQAGSVLCVTAAGGGGNGERPGGAVPPLLAGTRRGVLVGWDPRSPPSSPVMHLRASGATARGSGGAGGASRAMASPLVSLASDGGWEVTTADARGVVAAWDVRMAGGGFGGGMAGGGRGSAGSGSGPPPVVCYTGLLAGGGGGVGEGGGGLAVGAGLVAAAAADGGGVVLWDATRGGPPVGVRRLPPAGATGGGVRRGAGSGRCLRLAIGNGNARRGGRGGGAGGACLLATDGVGVWEWAVGADRDR
ncbi:hypothetical protein MMPV_001036 [Pyropia vietnamensis]